MAQLTVEEWEHEAARFGIFPYPDEIEYLLSVCPDLTLQSAVDLAALLADRPAFFAEVGLTVEGTPL